MGGQEDQFVGTAKEFQGKVTGDKDREDEGKVQNAQGKVEKTAENAVDKAKGAAQAVGDKLADR
jgi:uncharacterized protein YjbJ (UPF0337 family)